MLKLLFAGIALITFLAAPQTFASPIADKIIKAAAAECATVDNGVMTTTDKVITKIDLNGDGKLDEVVDASEFHCPTSLSYFCGTGGCYITFIIDGKSYEHLARDWKLVTWSEQPIILLNLHGNACNVAGVHLCYQALVWSKGSLRSTTDK